MESLRKQLAMDLVHASTYHGGILEWIRDERPFQLGAVFGDYTELHLAAEYDPEKESWMVRFHIVDDSGTTYGWGTSGQLRTEKVS